MSPLARANQVTLEQALHDTEIALELTDLAIDGDGCMRRVPRTVKVRTPPGVGDREILRVPGKVGQRPAGGTDGDLYLDIRVQRHAPVSRRRQ